MNRNLQLALQHAEMARQCIQNADAEIYMESGLDECDEAIGAIERLIDGLRDDIVLNAKGNNHRPVVVHVNFKV